MKQIPKLRQRIVAIFVLAAMLVSSCAQQTPSVGQEVNPALAQSSSSSPIDVVSAEGTVVPRRKADLSFNSSGRIVQILVEEGQQVTAEQELARLDTRDLEQAVLQAQAGLKSAQAQLDKVRAGARPEEIASAEAQVAIASAGVQSAMGAVDIAKGRVEGAKADQTVANDAIAVAESTLASAQAGLGSAQASLNKVLAGATDIQRQIAEKQLEQAKNELWSLQEQRDATFGVLQGQIAAAEVGVEIAELSLQEIKAGPRSEDVAIARSQVSEAQAGVQIASAQVDQAKSAALQAQAGVQIAQAQMAQAESEVASAQAREQQAKAELNIIRAGSRAEDIAVAEAAVAQAEAVLAAANNALDDAVLKAPFDGTIGAVLVDEGELVFAQNPVVRLGDLSRFEVETEDLSEVDVSSVKVDQPVVITVDALDGKTFDGRVTQIAPTATDNRGDKVYAVRIEITDESTQDLRWGMSTFVEIKVR